MDPYNASYGVEDAEFAITQLAQTTMRYVPRMKLYTLNIVAEEFALPPSVHIKKLLRSQGQVS